MHPTPPQSPPQPPRLQRTRRRAASVLVGAVLLPSLGHALDNSMAERTRACTACHGDQGRAGPDGYYPRLAGKPAGYLYNQLHNFQQGRRQYSPMQNLIAPLSDSYLRAMAEHFASLRIAYPAPLASTAPAAVLLRGQTLALHGDNAQRIPACVQCHGQALTGVLPHIPGLLGLPRDYLNAQLGGWQTGQRSAQAPDCMATIAQRMTPYDVYAVSHWLSTQALPTNTQAAPAPNATTTSSTTGHNQATQATQALPACGAAPW